MHESFNSNITNRTLTFKIYGIFFLKKEIVKD